MITILLLTWLMTRLAPSPVHLDIGLRPAQTITVTFPPMVFDQACVVFTSTHEMIEQGGKMVPYAPRHCTSWLDDPTLTNYQDDWDWIDPDEYVVTVEAFLANSDAKPVVSNAIKVVRLP